MPAIRRSSQAGKKPRDLASRQPLQIREGSWEHVEAGNVKHYPSLFSPDRDDFVAPTSTSKALRPLQTMAERIGEQVEDFAKRVDQWQGSVKSARSKVQKHRSTMTLVQSLGKIASSTATKLEKQYGRENQELLQNQLQKRINALDDNASVLSGDTDGSSIVPADKNVARLRHWQAEADTWELLRLILEMDFPEPGTNLKQRAKDFAERNGAAHTFTPDKDLWERFCLLDDVARERKVVLEWLERTAQHSENDIADIVTQLESAAGHGKGTWSQGWLATREAIKGRKRMMFPASSIRTNMVTELDPDATTRQGKSLDKEDEMYERSLWLATWEMLRQGTPWEEMREWFAERKENWRGVSLGMAYPEQDSRICLGGPNSGTLWRRMCLMAATNTASRDDYERAVYGLLSGDVASVDRVCQRWDDFLYSRYNSLLISRWDAWLHKHFPDRLPSEFLRRFGINATFNTDEEEAVAGAKVVDFLKSNSRSRSEALQPLKQIQGSVLAKSFQDLLYSLGVAISRTAYVDGRESKLIEKTTQDADEAAYIFIEDENALRIAAHLYIIYRSLGFKFENDDKTDTMENVLVCYIDLLRLSGQVESIPTYCAELSPKRAEFVLGRVLLDVLEEKEQKLLVELMREKDIDVVRVLVNQYMFALNESSLRPAEPSFIDTLDLLEETKLPRYPKQRIKRDFDMQTLTQDEERVARSAEWFLHLPGQWDVTFFAVTEIMKLLLLSGRYSAAMLMASKIPFKKLSMSKSPSILNKSIDVFDYSGPAPEEFTRSTRSTTKRKSAQQSAAARKEEELNVKAMQQTSRSYFEMLQLVAVLEVMKEWTYLESEFDKSVKLGSAQLPVDIKPRVQSCFKDLVNSMEPLLSPDFLTNIREETDVPYFTRIRHAYLPSIILAYNSVLHCSAVIQTREHLLQALELANIIAAEENAALAECFVKTGRMGELVNAFASNSKSLLVLNEAREATGKRGREKKKRGWEGETVDIWDVERKV